MEMNSFSLPRMISAEIRDQKQHPQLKLIQPPMFLGNLQTKIAKTDPKISEKQKMF